MLGGAIMTSTAPTSPPLQLHLPFPPSLPWIEQFEQWVLGPFGALLRTQNRDGCDPTELISETQKWVEELRELCASGLLRSIAPLSACQVASLFAYVLAEIEQRLHPAEVTFFLYPIDDLLVGLSIVELGQLPPVGLISSSNSQE